MSTFEEWWKREGASFDPDWESVPWFEKRKALAEKAFEAAMTQSGNYVADDDTYPSNIVFANGRHVAIGSRIDGAAPPEKVVVLHLLIK